MFLIATWFLVATWFLIATWFLVATWFLIATWMHHPNQSLLCLLTIPGKLVVHKHAVVFVCVILLKYLYTHARVIFRI